MSAENLRASRWRENAPLLGVSAILALAFLMLAVLAPHRPVDSAGAFALEERRGGSLAAPESALSSLPATAGDTVVHSDLSAADAQKRNAAVPFAALGPGKPLPFAFRGGPEDRARAVDCLALAGMAEAGGAEADQRAVMQVVLNRVRHPAFAKTVCGVVFEGSERAIGCQFSFTCDGSLARRYSETAWATARRRAESMLEGSTYAPVGNATHFHADYVYPWWSDRLDKVAQVGPHLFFRWRGFWGTGKALSARYAGGEPDPLALQRTAQAVAEAHPLPTLLQSGEAVRSITAPAPESPSGAGRAQSPPNSPGPGVHFVLVDRGDSPEALVERARSLCPGDRYCQVYGWSDGDDIPARLPLTEKARQTLRFSFLPSRSGNPEAIYLDCGTFPAPAIGACLPRARP